MFRAASPALLISSSNDSRTETSSSTTNTMGVGSAMVTTSFLRLSDGLRVYDSRMTCGVTMDMTYNLPLPHAFSSASSNAVSLNGFSKHATAPAATRRAGSDRSPWAVMNTTGSLPSPAQQLLVQVGAAHAR